MINRLLLGTTVRADFRGQSQLARFEHYTAMSVCFLEAQPTLLPMDAPPDFGDHVARRWTHSAEYLTLRENGTPIQCLAQCLTFRRA